VTFIKADIVISNELVFLGNMKKIQESDVVFSDEVRLIENRKSRVEFVIINVKCVLDIAIRALTCEKSRTVDWVRTMNRVIPATRKHLIFVISQVTHKHPPVFATPQTVVKLLNIEDSGKL